jgi:tetratricopeptide (TPR) repeat protein
MDRYLDSIEAGSTDVEAFEEAFGITLLELRKQLITYLNGNYQAFPIPLASLNYTPTSPRVRTLPRDEISVALGELALVYERSDLALDLFGAARAANSDNARAHAGFGKALAASGREAEAEPYFAQAISIGAGDAEIHLDYAKYLHKTALADGDETAATRRLEDARTHYQRSLKLDPQLPETHAMYGRSYLAPGQDSAQGVELLERAQALLPANPTILLLLARAYLLSDRESDARPLVARVAAISHGDDRVAKADEMLASLREADDESW